MSACVCVSMYHAVGGQVEDTAGAEDVVNVHLVAERRPHHFTVKELAVRLTECLVRTHVILHVRTLLTTDTDTHTQCIVID